MNWKLWRCTRPTSIRPVTELFDTGVQDQINALEPLTSPGGESKNTSDIAKLAIPLYQVEWTDNHSYYTTELHEAKRFIDKFNAHDKGVVGRVLSAPEFGSVPFLRTWSECERSFYTADLPVELNKRIISHEETVKNHAGYVFRTQKEGTVPLFYMYHPTRRHHSYVTDFARIEHCCQHGGYKSVGIVCYLFPA